MSLGNWLAENWFTLVQTIGIVTGVPGLYLAWKAIRDNAKAIQIQNAFTLVEQHREHWNRLYEYPALFRILERNVDLKRNPLRREEELFVTQWIIHVKSAFEAKRYGLVSTDTKMADDVGESFSLPIPRAVWSRVKHLHESEFVAFVEDGVATNAKSNR